MTDQMIPAERLREAARTLRNDIREPYDAPLADLLDAEAVLSDFYRRRGIAEEFRRRNQYALAVADSVLRDEWS